MPVSLMLRNCTAIYRWSFVSWDPYLTPMPLAPVDQQGISLYYEDSGVTPGSSTYVTLVIVHGGVFHGGQYGTTGLSFPACWSICAFLAVFEPIIAFANHRNVRIVRVNLRDYPGSTPFSSAELEVIHNGSHDEQVALIRARGLELGSFLTWFIRISNIPAPSSDPTESNADRQSGGLSVLAWSAGNCAALSFFAYAHLLPAQDQDLLAGYLRSYILFGA